MSPPFGSDRITLDIQLEPVSTTLELQEIRQGLTDRPRRLLSKYFYDKRGSALFEEITRLPEYYPTRTEQALLREVAEEISRRTGAEELVELGAGAATKTRVLLDAMQSSGNLRLYVPFDVSETEVRRVATELTCEYPDLLVHGIVADFVHHLGTIPPGQPRLVILLGSTIGNFTPAESSALLSRISRQMAPGDYLLLGADLIKDAEVIERAYNDAQGVTAEFNKNILRVVNQVAKADFDPDLYEHLALYNGDRERIEMYLVARRAHQVAARNLDLTLEIGDGEALRTEISCKYHRPGIEAMLTASGFRVADWYTDAEQLFALALARRR